jgi:hypothetical protein
MFQTNAAEATKTHILCSVTFFFENRAVYEIMWKNIVSPPHATDDNTIWRMRIACWTATITNTDSQHV